MFPILPARQTRSRRIGEQALCLPPLILALESTCDETAAAVIRGGEKGRGPEILASVVASHHDLYGRFSGVVPEIAARAHLERILPVIDDAIRRAGVTLDQLGAVAVATQPGLAGSLLIGLTAAKAFAWRWIKS